MEYIRKHLENKNPKLFNIKMTRELESKVLLMCNLCKGIEEKGIKEGILSSIARQTGSAAGLFFYGLNAYCV